MFLSDRFSVAFQMDTSRLSLLIRNLKLEIGNWSKATCGTIHEMDPVRKIILKHKYNFKSSCLGKGVF